MTHRLLAPLAALAVVAALASATPAGAYTVKPGDLLLRPVAGASVNAMRFSAATRATPQGGMLLGVDFDWSFDGALAFTAALRPVVSPGYLDVNLGLGAKYRLVQLGAPFIPYGSAMLTSAVGGPFGHGDVHWNEGIKLAGGVDYFVVRNLAVGLEVAVEGSTLLNPVFTPEVSTELLAGVTFRL
ncbi:MAG: hypothetical protein HYS27_15050 [Deltaproteobacteria bacterium]|nr:hypothetical protein [Deltaproteobacteria bacterium]